MTKSMLYEMNLDAVIGDGCSRPVGKNVESLAFLQISHAEMNMLTEAQSFGHQKGANRE